MSNPEGPDQPDEVTDEVTEAADGAPAEDPGPNRATEVMASSEPDHEPATEVHVGGGAVQRDTEEPERRFTAPSGFDAGATTRIDTPSEPATEVMATAAAPVSNPFHHKSFRRVVMHPNRRRRNAAAGVG